MLHRLVQLMAARWGVVVVAALALGIVSALRVANTPLEVFPEFVTPQVTIQTEAAGLTAEQVEQLVTRPLESVVNGSPGLESMRSESLAGLSVVVVSFRDGEDPSRVRQGIAERLSEIGGRLPHGVGAPTMSPLTSSTMDLLSIGLVSQDTDLFALREIADWSLKPRFLAVPGVARVTVFGGESREIQVIADPERLRDLGLSLSDIVDAAGHAVVVRGGGFVDTPEQRVVIQAANGARTPEQIGQALVARRHGVSLRLSDVAHVQYGPAVKVGDALVQGRPGVLLTMSGQYGANTLESTRAIEAVLADLAPALRSRGIELFPALHRPATFIELALRNLVFALGLGGVLILLVLFAFLKDWRPALISFVTIPLSLSIAAALLSWLGLRLDTMVLGGFAVASGVLVDDAIIDVENVLRRLRQRGPQCGIAEKIDIVASASVEIRVAVFFGTAVALMVFLPVITMSGVQGRFLAPLGLAFIVAVLVSLVVAATLTPALCAWLLRVEVHHREPRWLEWFKRLHARGVVVLRRFFWPTVAALVVALGFAAALVPSLQSDFLPAFREGHFVVQLTSNQPGTSLRQMLAVGRSISMQMLALPFVATVQQQAGRAERAEDTWATDRSEMHVELKADVPIDQDQAERELRAIVAGYPGMRSEVLTFLGDRISETLTGETAQIVINVFGDDLDSIERAASSVGAVVSRIPGAVDVQVKRASGAPQLSVALDRAALTRVGLDSESVLADIDTAYAGTVVGQVYDGARAIDVSVMAPLAWRERLDALSRLPITLPSGQMVQLGQLASVRLDEGRASIRRDRGRRAVAVTLNAEDRSAASVVSDARAALAATVRLPAGVVLEFGGVAEADRLARRDLLVHGLLAGVAIAMILAVGFRRLRHTWLVLLNLPFALVGSIAAIGLTGVGLSLGALVGVVTVFGISARNAIMLLSHYEHLVDEEGSEWNEELVVRGARERLVPVLMTATVTGTGLLPLAFGLGMPGYELEGPLAVAVLGGLFSSTLLNLFVLPEITRRFGLR